MTPAGGRELLHNLWRPCNAVNGAKKGIVAR
jgi:hypothetical protein